MTTATQTETTKTADAVLGVHQLRQLLESVLFAACPESGRYALQSVQLRFLNGKLTATATDGYRLATTTIAAHHCEDFEVLIPRKDAKAIVAKITKTATGDVALYRDGANVKLSWIGHRRRRIVFAFDVTEGRFPNWESIIPDTGKAITTISASAAELSASLDFDRDCYLLDFAKREVRRVAQLPKLSIKGDKSADFHGNVDYLLEYLETLPESTRVDIHLFESSSPIVVESGYSTYVLMPCNRA